VVRSCTAHTQRRLFGSCRSFATLQRFMQVREIRGSHRIGHSNAAAAVYDALIADWLHQVWPSKSWCLLPLCTCYCACSLGRHAAERSASQYANCYSQLPPPPLHVLFGCPFKQTLPPLQYRCEGVRSG
jgi:hypothetical protein